MNSWARVFGLRPPARRVTETAVPNLSLSHLSKAPRRPWPYGPGLPLRRAGGRAGKDEEDAVDA